MTWPFVLEYHWWSGELIRVSLALFLLHIVIMLCCLTRDSFAQAVNERGFGFKFLVVAVGIFGLLFLPNHYLRIYVTITSFVGVLFLLYQSIALVDFAYVWNETWVKRYEDGVSCYGVLLVIGSIGLLALTGVATVYNFNLYWIDGCKYYKSNLIGTLLLTIAMLALAVARPFRSSSILSALFIAAAFTYANGYALASFYDDTCNPWSKKGPDGTNLLNSALHLMINAAAGLLTVLCLSVDVQPSEGLGNIGLAPRSAEDPEPEKEIPMVHETHQTNTVPVIYQSNYFVWFHFVMAAFAIYLVPVFFDWRDLNINVEKWSELLASSPSAFFIKTFSAFTIILLYIWTLIAPAFLPQREFE